MSEISIFRYVTGEDDNAYVCPLETGEISGRAKMEQLDDCIEADVVGRYSGNIQIVRDYPDRPVVHWVNI